MNSLSCFMSNCNISSLLLSCWIQDKEWLALHIVLQFRVFQSRSLNRGFASLWRIGLEKQMNTSSNNLASPSYVGHSMYIRSGRFIVQCHKAKCFPWAGNWMSSLPWHHDSSLWIWPPRLLLWRMWFLTSFEALKAATSEPNFLPWLHKLR